MLRTTLLLSAVSLVLALPASAETKPYDMNSFSALKRFQAKCTRLAAWETRKTKT